jgi:hypothetical protein
MAAAPQSEGGRNVTDYFGYARVFVPDAAIVDPDGFLISSKKPSGASDDHRSGIQSSEPRIGTVL